MMKHFFDGPSLAASLCRLSLFEGLADEQISAVAAIAAPRRYGKGELIFSDGDRGDGFYAIVSGQVKVFKMSDGGKEQILHIFGPGDPFGEVPVFEGRSFPASAMAITDSRLVFFPRREFVALIHDYPSLALGMLAVLSRRLRLFTTQIENLSLKEVPQRLAGYLLYLSEEQEGADTVSLPISKGQLASLIGTVPETLSRVFAKMSADGLIEVEGKRIRLLDREGLHPSH